MSYKNYIVILQGAVAYLRVSCSTQPRSSTTDYSVMPHELRSSWIYCKFETIEMRTLKVIVTHKIKI